MLCAVLVCVERGGHVCSSRLHTACIFLKLFTCHCLTAIPNLINTFEEIICVYWQRDDVA